MKLITAWWGVQFVSESEEDKEMLTKLHSTIKDNRYLIYEDGSVQLLTEYEPPKNYNFGYDLELKPGEVMLEIAR